MALCGITAVYCLFVYLFVHRVTSSPLGRALRAIRDNEDAAQALGKDVVRLRLFIFVMGDVIAGISGAVLVEFIGAWSPGSWLYVETFVFFTAIIVGGTGNNAGVMLGALLVPVAFNELTRYIPPHRQAGADRRAAVDRDRPARAGLPLVLAARHHPRAAAAVPRRAPWSRPPRSDRPGEVTDEHRDRSRHAQSAAPGDACLSVEDLRRDFGGVWAFDGASFAVRRGAITSLIGPNGAGKSTVVGIVGGAIRPAPDASSSTARTSPRCRRTSALGAVWCAPTSSRASSAGSPCSRTCSSRHRGSAASGCGRCCSASATGESRSASLWCGPGSCSSASA